MKASSVWGACIVLALASSSVWADDTKGKGHGKGHDKDHGKGRYSTTDIPPGHMPPAGQCRIWHNDRPPGHQPAPGNCAQLSKQKLPNGARLIRGEDRK